MTRYLLAGAALLSAVLWGWVQMQRADALEDKLRTANARIESYEAAAAVHRAHIERLQAMAEDAVKLDREFQEKDGANEKLPDYLRSNARKLWP